MTVGEGLRVLSLLARVRRAGRRTAVPPATPEPKRELTLKPAITPKEDPIGVPVFGRVTSKFGLRMHPIKKQRLPHMGVDIGAREGSPVWTTGSGRVIHAGRRGGHGLAVIVDHGGGRTTLYAHLSEVHVRVGDHVDAGQWVGAVGSTGQSTGPHLHYEVQINGVPVDPGIAA